MRGPKIVAGQVMAVREHPNGEYIRLAVVDIGSGNKVQIVFGGPDLVIAGDFVPVALPGALLPGRKKLRRSTFRGESSYGMLCSAAELGWVDNGPDEVALLKPEGLEPGTSLEHAEWSSIRTELDTWRLEKRTLWEEMRRTAPDGSFPFHPRNSRPWL